MAPNTSLKYAALFSSTICLLSPFQAPVVIGIIHRQQTGKKLDPISAAHFDPLRWHVRSYFQQFLAAPYAGRNRSGILRRVTGRSISQTSRQRVSSTTRERRERQLWVRDDLDRPLCRTSCRATPRFVTLERPLPRFVEVRRARPRFGCVLLPDPDLLPQLGCEMANEPLGTSYENHDVLPRRLAALPLDLSLGPSCNKKTLYT